MSDVPTIHAFIFCWPKWEAATHHIAAALDGHVDHLTVMYKNDTGVDEIGPGEWRRIPSSCYYGWQFAESLRLNRGDVMLHVQADAGSGGWPHLVARCRDAFHGMPDLGVWAPNVDYTPWSPQLTQVRSLGGNGLAAVTLTDGILWALSRAVVERLGRLDYAHNNLGWGMGSAAAAMAMTNGLAVAMDLTLDVTHPKGSGYDQAKAQEEMAAFMGQLPAAQRAYIDMAVTMATLRREQRDLPRYLEPGFWRGRLSWRRAAMMLWAEGKRPT